MTLPTEWGVCVANHRLRPASDLQEEANRNMLVLPLSDISSQSIETHELAEFLMSVYREFLGKSEQAGFLGWFYAWLDEMSGTLRCGAGRVASPSELPFSCALKLVDIPGPLAREVANSNYRSGIPADEFQDTAFNADDDDDEKPFTLTVFVRPLMRSA